MVFNAAELTGNTPLIRLERIEKEYGLNVRLFAKIEAFNPAGSIKDRVAVHMIDQAEKNGLIIKGGTLIEASSGNTGIGLAMVAKARDYRLVLTMPDNMSIERQQLLRAYGAHLELTEGALGMAGALKRAKDLAHETPGSFYTAQFDNPSNPQAHYLTTGPEIAKALPTLADILVSAVGTGGTLTGTGRYLRERNPNLRIVAVEPAGSPVLSGGQKGPHKIEGIGAGFIPSILDTTLYDAVVPVHDEEAAEATRLLLQTTGLLCGISSGAALCASIRTAQLMENERKTLVMILPDTGTRYLSGTLFKGV